ncbi:hypothetical protein [Novosphingobium sp. ST904]|uniref:hypothetical protein n=1 Tax=Novosphingobium sp. ST904 TaxID=1684385 RepID=UPI0006C8ADBE|nr:hypothetical protein [Novosphingobium sp. ST904]KPH59165.1 hypothetical protein ADT71_23765 [Novosphingobium sp. ST904]TCM37752.1 hypothetical protein EDF59_110148 [Novosphingobium sp. ST904]
MTRGVYVPVDECARNGRFLSLRADDGTPHCASWDSELGGFAYGPGLPVQKRITHYFVRLPGAPPAEGSY